MWAQLPRGHWFGLCRLAKSPWEVLLSKRCVEGRRSCGNNKKKALRMRERQHSVIFTHSWKTWKSSYLGHTLTVFVQGMGKRAINNEIREKNRLKETEEVGMGETQTSNTIHSNFGNKNGFVVPTNMAQQRPFCPGIYHFINL